MPPPPDRERHALIAVMTTILLGLAWLAWEAVGGFGVALLGLLILFVAVRVEIEGDRPVGTHSKPEHYAAHVRVEADKPRSERAGRSAEIASIVRSARLFMLAGAVLTATGFALVYLGFRAPQGQRPVLAARRARHSVVSERKALVAVVSHDFNIEVLTVVVVAFGKREHGDVYATARAR